ncbi:MAG: NAD(P)-dependent oxidoreductase [Thermoanaerobaculia bacterium]
MPVTVFIAADVDPELLERLGRDTRFAVRHEPATDEEALVRGVPGAEILVTRHYNKITRRVLDAGDALRVIVQGTSGLDNVDPSWEERGIRLLGVPGENANAVGELAIALMITLTRTVASYDRTMRGGTWDRSDCARRRELRGHRIGIVGLGRVGGRVARLAAAFGASPAAYDPYLSETEMQTRGAAKVDELDALLEASDVLTLHVPLTGETRGMLDASRIARLPRGAVVINTARGEVADVDALLGALAEDRLGGVALDVYDPEPPRRTWPDDPRLIVTPHIAGCTGEARASIGIAVYRRICESQGLAPLS